MHFSASLLHEMTYLLSSNIRLCAYFTCTCVSHILYSVCIVIQFYSNTVYIVYCVCIVEARFSGESLISGLVHGSCYIVAHWFPLWVFLSQDQDLTITNGTVVSLSIWHGGGCMCVCIYMYRCSCCDIFCSLMCYITLYNRTIV